jgi:hypothetical protein
LVVAGPDAAVVDGIQGYFADSTCRPLTLC